MRFIEVCCCGLRDVEEAVRGGASRIELCADLEVGGLTPGGGLIECARIATGKEVAMNVLVRPRAGDFVYDSHEIAAMLAEIELCGRLHADGVVVGALTCDGEIDMATMERMVGKAKEYGMSVTFHRAFDTCRRPAEALEQIIATGCDRLLTSGCQPNAAKGSQMIAKLIAQAQKRIVIMPGCGITPINISMIELTTCAKEFHSSARSRYDKPASYHGAAVSFEQNGATPMRVDSEVVAQLTDKRQVQ